MFGYVMRIEYGMETMADYLFIVAHPDDESLWCGSIIRHLRKQNDGVTILCLTNGDHAARRAEFFKACLILDSKGIMMDLKDGKDFPDFKTELDQVLVENDVSWTTLTCVVSHSFFGEEQNHFQHIQCFHQVQSWCKDRGLQHGFFSERNLLAPTSSMMDLSSPKVFELALKSFMVGLLEIASVEGIRLRRRIKFALHALRYAFQHFTYRYCVMFPVDVPWKHRLLDEYVSREDVRSDKHYKTYNHKREYLYLTKRPNGI